MTADALLLEWIPDGGLPIYQMDGPAPRYYQFDGNQWDPRRRLRDGKVLVSLDIDAFLHDFQLALQGYLDLLDAMVAVAGTVIFVLRTCCDLDDSRLVVAGMAFVEGRVPGATSLDGASAAALILQTCRGLAGADSHTIHPALRAALERELAHRAAMEEARRQDEAAERRSLVLLESHLTETQLAEFRTLGVFHVTLRDGRRFRFCKRFGHNVHLLENGACVIEYCIITVKRVPLYDQMLAQKVMLEALPEEFFRIANHRSLPRPTIDPLRLPLAELANALAQV